MWSQTREKVWYNVHNKDGWTCECESYKLGHKVCSHMMAAFILAASGTRLAKRKGWANLHLPERWCRHCGSTDATWSENRPLKRMANSIGVGKVERGPLRVQRVQPQVCRQAGL